MEKLKCNKFPDLGRIKLVSIQRTFALMIGITMTFFGIAGFLTDSSLLVLFGVNLLHESAHLITGLLGLFAGIYAQGKLAKHYNKWIGLLYIVLGILGFFAGSVMKTLLNINFADNILHIMIGVILVGIALETD